jgi:hypothetical protein
MKEAYVVFECIGDLRKNLLATAVIPYIKKAYPDRRIVVVSTTPEVWLHNPHVYRFYNTVRMSYFYDDFVKDKEVIIMRHDPFATEDFVYDRKHVVEIWCDLCGVPCDGDNYNDRHCNYTPELYFTWREKEVVSKLLPLERPLFFIQTNIPSVNPQLTDYWPTDLPLSVAQQVVDEMNNRGYLTIHLRESNQALLRNVEVLNFDMRLMLCALSFSKKRLFVDSYAMHASTAFGLSSVVPWISGKPEVTGYMSNINLKARTSKETREKIVSHHEGYETKNFDPSVSKELENAFNSKELLDLLLNN